MTTDTEYDADDLLDENGNIDPSKVKSMAKTGKRTFHKVNSDECQQWRRVVDGGSTLRDATESVDPSVVRYHVTGECQHKHDAPPVEYHDEADEWRAVE